MIYYKPITDKKILTELFKNEDIKADTVCGGYLGYDENCAEVGKCYINIDGYKCYLSSVECDFSDKLLTEGFVRSALNFGANRNAYMAYCCQENISDVLTTLGFESKDGEYSGDIPTLLKGSCCK